jgi:hypothetical protein
MEVSLKDELRMHRDSLRCAHTNGSAFVAIGEAQRTSTYIIDGGRPSVRCCRPVRDGKLTCAAFGHVTSFDFKVVLIALNAIVAADRWTNEEDF